jgi:hypothetical protein
MLTKRNTKVYRRYYNAAHYSVSWTIDSFNTKGQPLMTAKWFIRNRYKNISYYAD